MLLDSIFVLGLFAFSDTVTLLPTVPTFPHCDIHSNPSPSSTTVLDVPLYAIGKHVIQIHSLGEGGFNHLHWCQGGRDGTEKAKGVN